MDAILRRPLRREHLQLRDLNGIDREPDAGAVAVSRSGCAAVPAGAVLEGIG